MTKYYALVSTGDIVYLGEPEDGQFLATDLPVIWLVDEDGAREWYQQLRELFG